jgi:hypothetical protein
MVKMNKNKFLILFSLTVLIGACSSSENSENFSSLQRVQLFEPEIPSRVPRMNPMVNGENVFLRSENRNLLKYPMTDFLKGQTRVKLHFDLGNLGVFNQVQAHALVERAMANFNHLNQQKYSQLVLERGEDINENITSATHLSYIYDNPDSEAANGNCIAPLRPEYQIMVIFDDDGLIFRNLFGVSPTAYSGFAISTCDPLRPQNYAWGFVLINGAVLHEGQELFFGGNEDKIVNLITHEIAHSLGVGHLFLNSTTGIVDTPNGESDYPLMYLDNRRDRAGFHASDVESIVSLYPHSEVPQTYRFGQIKGQLVSDSSLYADNLFSSNPVNLWLLGVNNTGLYSTTPYFNEMRFKYLVPAGQYQMHMQEGNYQFPDLTFYPRPPDNFDFSDLNNNLHTINVIENETTYVRFNLENASENTVKTWSSFKNYQENKESECYRISDQNTLIPCTNPQLNLKGGIVYRVKIIDRATLVALDSNQIIKDRVDIIGEMGLVAVKEKADLAQLFVIARIGELSYFLNADQQWELIKDVNTALNHLTLRKMSALERIPVAENFYDKNLDRVDLSFGLKIDTEIYVQKDSFRLNFK